MSRAPFLIVGLFLALSAQALRAARLAIVIEDPRLSTEADLLTTELSKRSDVELLEREQILKIRKEQSLAAGFGNDYLKLGKLLAVDGVLILDFADEPTRLLVSVRLAAVNPGVLLGVAEYDFPASELQDRPVGGPGTSDDCGSSVQRANVRPKGAVRLAGMVQAADRAPRPAAAKARRSCARRGGDIRAKHS
jgi:hypothetical protein